MMVDWAALQDRANTKAMQAFGVAVVFDGVSISADFLAPTDELFLDGVSAMSNTPQLLMLTKDVPAAPVGKTVVVNGETYRVAEIAHDGRGMTRCMLEVVL